MSSWVGLVNATFEGGVLTKTAGDYDADAGGHTADAITSDGYLQITTQQNTHWLAVGLGGLENWTFQPDSIAYRWDLGPTGYAVPFIGNAAIWDAETTYAANDVFRIERTGSTVRFWRNGGVHWTVLNVAPQGTLRGLATLISVGSQLSNTTLVSTGGTLLATRGRIGFAEIEVPTLGVATSTRGRISVAEFQASLEIETWPHGFQGWEPPPVTATNTITLNPGDNVQAALNTLGTTGGTLNLNPGTYLVNLFWSERTTAHPVRIRTTPSVNLPSAGTRVLRTHKPVLAVLKSSNNFDPVITMNHRAMNLYFENLCFDSLHKDHQIVVLGWDISTLKTTSQRASGFLFDRCLFDGHPTNGQKRAIMANCKDLIIRYSSFYDCFSTDYDAQCIAGWNGVENHLYEWCFFEGAGENVMFGGASSAAYNPDGSGAGMEPRHVTIQDCHFTKNPAWRTMSPAPVAKALFELKHLRGLLMQRCLLEYNWNTAWPEAVAMIIKCLNDEAMTLDTPPQPGPYSEPTVRTNDCMFRDLIIRDCGVPLVVVGHQDVGDNYPTERMFNVRFENILMYRLNYTPYVSTGKQMFRVANPGHDTRFNHITVRANPAYVHSWMQMWWDNGPLTADRFHFTNNITHGGEYGLRMEDDPDVLPGTGDVQKFNNMLPGATVSGNALRTEGEAEALTGVTYLSQAAFDASFDSLHRVIPGSAIANITTTDGKPPGADVNDLKAKMPWVTIAGETALTTRGRMSFAVFDVPLVKGTQVASDNFNRADGPLAVA